MKGQPIAKIAPHREPPDSREGGESYTFVVIVEYGVVVFHPTSAENPQVASNASKVHITNNAAHASGRARRNWPRDKRGSRHRKVLASNIERDGRDVCIAREGIEAFTNGEARVFGPWDLGVEVFYRGARTNDEISRLFRFD